jgi:drug/metabolite transporter (DMT)-like permease
LNESHLKAIGMMVMAVLSFTVLDAIAKYLTKSYPVPFVVWARYAAHCIMMLVIFGPKMRMKLFETKRPKVQLLRGVSLIGATGFFFSALSVMALADAQSVALIAPVLVTLAANQWLKEPLPKQTWWVLIVSFCGVLLVVKPGTSVFAPATLLALCSALCFTCYQLTTRMVAQVDNNLSTLFMGGLIGTVIASLALPWVIQWPKSLFDAGLFVALGAIGAGGHLLMLHAFERAPASRLAPFVYLQIVGALSLGWLVFGSFPDGWSLIGMSMIAATGVLNALIRPQKVPLAGIS